MTLDDIRNALLAGGRGYALDLVRAIQDMAAKDASYDLVLICWLKKGGTVILRDTLVAPFHKAAFVHYVASSEGLSLHMAFQSCWEAVDSAFLRVRGEVLAKEGK